MRYEHDGASQRALVGLFDDYGRRFLANLWEMAVGSAPGMQEAGRDTPA
jgi:hypothetical protein